MEIMVGIPVLIHHGERAVHRDRIKRVFKNGRFELRGKVGSWYVETDNLARMWNKPDYVVSDMVAEIVPAA